MLYKNKINKEPENNRIANGGRVGSTDFSCSPKYLNGAIVWLKA